MIYFDLEVVKCFKIGVVICCIDLFNIFMENRYGYNMILNGLYLVVL